MAGQGGYKHRMVRLKRKHSRTEQIARENIRRVQNQFETKGQTWDPQSDGAQMAALNHAARRFLARGDTLNQ